MVRRPTSTSAFGVSRRESHDAGGFYRRFTPPTVSTESEVADWRAVDKLMVGDARQMKEVPDASVALVVTSPPYFAGKEYEEALGGAIPGTYLEYLQLIRDVLGECVKKLEPGGRLAVNVANLGRRPYRSLSADVIGILQDDLGLLLRGEIIWVKQRGSSGSCAWGSFQQPANPVLRDLTERVIVASKGRFDRALPIRERARRGLPWESSMTRDDFMEDTLDLWEIPPESATRVGHPAPFPVELAARLIELYTYRGDLVLDPFAGSGSTAVAAVASGRHYAGYDLDPSYVRLGEDRVEAAERRDGARVDRDQGGSVLPSSGADQLRAEDDPWAASVRRGLGASAVARALIEEAGFVRVQKDQRQAGGVQVDFSAHDAGGRLWLFDVAGSFTSFRPGLARPDALWKALGKAAVLHQGGPAPYVLLTAGRPRPGSPGAKALDQILGSGRPVHAVIEMLIASGRQQMRELAAGRGYRPPSQGEIGT
jgi:DNA modification methylase